MRRTTMVLFGCVIVAVVALGAGCLIGGSWVGALVVTGVGGVWLLAHLLGKRSVIILLAWLCLMGAAAIGVATNLPAGLMLVGVVAALCAWDMTYYEQRHSEVARVDTSDALDRRHMMRLALTAATGLTLGAMSLLIRVDIGFGVAIVLAIAAVILLSQLVRLSLPKTH